MKMMGDGSFQDVAFLPPSRASFCTTVLKNCGRGESLWTTTYNRTVVVGKQGHAPCRICLLQQSLLFVPVYFILRLQQRLGKSVLRQFWDITGFKAVVSVCVSCHCATVKGIIGTNVLAV